MTTPESIVVSLEWARKLKEAGWPQEDSLMCWIRSTDTYTDKVSLSRRTLPKNRLAASPTAEEILRRLPRYLPWKDDSDNMAALFVNVFPSSYRVGYSPQWTQDAWSTPDAETLADAAAGCYCYLSENNLLPSDDA